MEAKTRSHLSLHPQLTPGHSSSCWPRPLTPLQMLASVLLREAGDPRKRWTWWVGTSLRTVRQPLSFKGLQVWKQTYNPSLQILKATSSSLSLSKKIFYNKNCQNEHRKLKDAHTMCKPQCEAFTHGQRCRQLSASCSRAVVGVPG